MTEWPSEIIPPQMDFYVVHNDREFPSIFTGDSQIAGYPGSYWRADIDIPLLDKEQSRIFSAFINSLQGMSGEFRMPTWHRVPAPPAGNAVVNGSGQAGTQLSTRGWNASAQVLRRGDYITLNDQLLEVTADVTSNDQGEALIQFAPWLRSTPANGATLNYTDPYCRMRLNADGSSSSYQGVVASGTVSCRESF